MTNFKIKLWHLSIGKRPTIHKELKIKVWLPSLCDQYSGICLHYETLNHCLMIPPSKHYVNTSMRPDL